MIKIAIIGGGLAGSCLAKLLYDKGIEFHWYLDNKSSASKISSGILNPVTGRRYALAWQYTELLITAKEFYGNYLKPIRLEKHFSPFKNETTLDEIVRGKEEFLAKINEEWIEVKESYQLQTNEFIKSIKDHVEVKNQIVHDKFDPTCLKRKEFLWYYNHHSYSQVLFAEGIFVKNNPFFNYLPFQPNRGEALVLDIYKNKPSSVKKHGKFICPFGDKYWVGSSFDKVEFDAPLLTEKTKQELLNILPNLAKDSDYQIIDHLGALRSTTPDRRPIIGEHPVHKDLYLFNGFGTKGSSLIPWCAIQLINLLLFNQNLPDEISICRINK